MSHREIAEAFLRMGAITRRFLAAVKYRGNPALPLFPWYPQSSSSSASTGRSHAAPSSSSRPPYEATFYPARPPAHPPLRMFPLGGLLRGPALGGQDRHHEDRTYTSTSTSSTSSSTSRITGFFLVTWPCSSVRYSPLLYVEPYTILDCIN
jgi:hypothetical protein